MLSSNIRGNKIANFSLGLVRTRKRDLCSVAALLIDHLLKNRKEDSNKANKTGNI